MRHLVIGMGQIGSAIHAVLAGGHEVEGIDIKNTYQPKYPQYDFLHVCFPCVEQAVFAKEVQYYMRSYLAPTGTVIIHSTVPVGTTRMCGPSVVHSPCRGVHPNLVPGIKTFAKYFGCEDEAARYAAMLLFGGMLIPAYGTDKPENTEALKLWDTTIYGINIILEKEIKAYCTAHGLDFDLVYTKARRHYNDGFARLGMPQYTQYCLEHRDGPIGGHCVVPNAKLLGHPVGEFILEWQAEAERGAQS